MTTLYDEEGNLMEGALDPTEVKTLQDNIKNKDEEISSVREKLAKLENKDYNFKKLRDMTKEEMEKLSGKEVELLKRQEKLEEEQKNFTDKVVNSYKDDALAVLAGNDKDLREKILFHYDRIKDDAVSKEEIQNKIKEAYLLASERAKAINPLSAAMSYRGSPPNVKKGKEPVSEDQKDLARKLGINEEDLKKYGYSQ